MILYDIVLLFVQSWMTFFKIFGTSKLFNSSTKKIQYISINVKLKVETYSYNIHFPLFKKTCTVAILAYMQLSRDQRAVFPVSLETSFVVFGWMDCQDEVVNHWREANHGIHLTQKCGLGWVLEASACAFGPGSSSLWTNQQWRSLF